ncbi:MAG: hypothetical protein ABI629_23730 [bacterium]
MLGRILALSALLLAGPVRADPAAAADAAVSPPGPTINTDPWLPIHTYTPDGWFVRGPAETAGMTMLIIVGGTAATFCMPIDLVRGMWRGSGYGSIAEACGARVGDAAATGSYLAAGAPFWATKQLVWNVPRRLLFGAPKAAAVTTDPELG